jgi:hypothetical protein
LTWLDPAIHESQRRKAEHGRAYPFEQILFFAARRFAGAAWLAGTSPAMTLSAFFRFD